MDLLVYLWLLLGFVLLIKGADFFVDGSSSVAKTFKVPSIIIGLTIVAMGTSLPETAVSVTAALGGANEIALSNVIGSNIFNLMVVVGACAIIKKIDVNEELINRDYPFSFVSTVVLLFVMADTLLFNKQENMLSRIDGIFMLVLFVLYMVVLISSTLNARKNCPEAEDEDYKLMPVWKSVILIAIGIAGIKFGGDLVVNSASEIATRFGLSPTFIGLTIVAMGTSLPELVTSIVASHKGENDLALGNVIGSNTFNVLLVLGVSSTINPVAVDMQSVYDMLVLLGFNILVYAIAREKRDVGKPGGVTMLVLYALYTGYIILRA